MTVSAARTAVNAARVRVAKHSMGFISPETRGAFETALRLLAEADRALRAVDPHSPTITDPESDEFGEEIDHYQARTTR
jgi:hypothetical protein